MSTVLVTGAAGFIGSHVAARLAGAGHVVHGVDSFNDYYPVELKHARAEALLRPRGVPCHRMDLCREEQVRELFDLVQPAFVVHLAAQAGVRHSITHPQDYIQSNLVAFGHVLESCRRHRIEHLVYASSSSVYGANSKVPFAEDDPTDQPVSLYAATKKANEAMAYSYAALYGLPTTGLRLFSVYGPWGRPDMAYFGFTEKILAGTPIQVFGDGTLLRDLTYIDDVVEAVVRLLRLAPGAATPPATVFNIGNRRPTSVRQLVAMLEQALDVEADIEYLPLQPGDVPATHADVRKLQEWTGFAPDTPLEAGLGRFVEWYRHWRSQRGHEQP